MGLFDELDSNTQEEEIIKAPFGWPGGKSKSLDRILPHLPYRKTYIEAFGGSGAVLLGRNKSELEVYNDRYGGVVDFYKCLRDAKLYQALVDRLEYSLHSREEWIHNHVTWKDTLDPVERAAKWYYMVRYSFAQIGRNFGRSTGSGTIAGRIQKSLPTFAKIHGRLVKVQIENRDWYDCLMDYDSPETVFYLDPPYIDSQKGAYRHEFTVADHRRLLDVIFTLEGFVAVSSYNSTLYVQNNWDDVITWEQRISLKSGTVNSGHNAAQLGEQTQNECLFIKE